MQIVLLGVATLWRLDPAIVPLVVTVARGYRVATLDAVTTTIAKRSSGPIVEQSRPDAECGVDSRMPREGRLSSHEAVGVLEGALDVDREDASLRQVVQCIASPHVLVGRQHINQVFRTP